MTWLQTLAAELQTRGVAHRERGRILLEFEDHIECDPGCETQLGDPRELADTFAEQLATARTRRSALHGFAALTGAAAVLTLSQAAIGDAIGGYPGYDHGLSVALFVAAALGMLIAPQVALVAGTLAALRALRRRRVSSLPAAELALIGRRTRVALWAGIATMAGLGLYLLDFSRELPAWYLALIGGLAGAGTVALAAAFRSLAQAQTIISERAGAAGDIYDDVPLIGWRWLRGHPWRLGALGTLIITLIAIYGQMNTEHSLAEGLQRGFAEGVAAAVGFVVLGRAVGLIGPRTASSSNQSEGRPKSED